MFGSKYKENCQSDWIPFNSQGNKNRFLFSSIQKIFYSFQKIFSSFQKIFSSFQKIVSSFRKIFSIFFYKNCNWNIPTLYRGVFPNRNAFLFLKIKQNLIVFVQSFVNIFLTRLRSIFMFRIKWKIVNMIIYLRLNLVNQINDFSECKTFNLLLH